MRLRATVEEGARARARELREAAELNDDTPVQAGRVACRQSRRCMEEAAIGRVSYSNVEGGQVNWERGLGAWCLDRREQKSDGSWYWQIVTPRSSFFFLPVRLLQLGVCCLLFANDNHLSHHCTQSKLICRPPRHLN
jgi:hypothetical protein